MEYGPDSVPLLSQLTNTMVSQMESEVLALVIVYIIFVLASQFFCPLTQIVFGSPHLSEQFNTNHYQSLLSSSQTSQQQDQCHQPLQQSLEDLSAGEVLQQLQKRVDKRRTEYRLECNWMLWTSVMLLYRKKTQVIVHAFHLFQFRSIYRSRKMAIALLV